MSEHLIITLEAPMMSFGGVQVDNHGQVMQFPAASMLTGLLGNAMGLKRSQRNELQEIQDRLQFATRIEQEAWNRKTLTDYQTVHLGEGVDPFMLGGYWVTGWTTRGVPETRSGSPETYKNGAHRRWRDYQTDVRAVIAARLDGPGVSARDMAGYLDEPTRPLFIGRKPCLPTTRIFSGFQEAETALEALFMAPVQRPEEGEGAGSEQLRVQWAYEDGPTPQQASELVRQAEIQRVPDLRNWRTMLHSGERWVYEGTADRSRFQAE